MSTSPAEQALGLTEDDLDKPTAWGPKNLSGRHLIMCEYHLAGFTNKEIAAQLGMHEVSVGLVLRSPNARGYIADRLEDLSQQFHGQFGKVIQTTSDALGHENIDVRLRAADMWLRSHGKYQPKSKLAEEPLKAEDVVKLLIDNAKNLTVNIDNRQQTIVQNDEPPPPTDDFSFLEN